MRKTILILSLFAGVALAQTTIGSVFQLTNAQESAFPTPSALYKGSLIYGLDGGAVYFTNGTTWSPLSAIVSGNTAARPSQHATGQTYFDTTLGIPIWWNGTNWVDATGVTV